MQLNISTCYGLQTILYLTRNNRVVSSAELSKNLDISQRYILQIAKKLRDGDLVDTHSGMNGGYTLSKEASTISVYDIVAIMEGDCSIPACVRSCHDATLNDALSALNDYLETYLKMLTFDKLADMETTGRLSEIISIVEAQISTMKEDA